MNKSNKWILFASIGLIAFIALMVWWFSMDINSNFATEVFLEFHYEDISISVTITDENDILILKQILSGRPFRDSPSCGFSTAISITMTNGRKSIMFCPANDGCPLLRIGTSDRYIRISDEAKARLNEVLERYGMFFPCI